MSKKTAAVAIVLPILLLISGFSAESANAESDEPFYFKMIEIATIGVSLITALSCYGAFTRVGGIVGKSFLMITVGSVLFSAAFLVRSLTEFGIVENSMLIQQAFEFLILAGLGAILYSSVNFGRTLSFVEHPGEGKKEKGK